MMKVNLFIHNLKNLIEKKSFKNFRNVDFKFLRDPIYDQSWLELSKKSKSFLIFFNLLNLFDPRKIIFKFTLIIHWFLIMNQFINIPFDVAFQIELLNNEKIIKILTIMTSVLEILLNFTGIGTLDNDAIVTLKKKEKNRYQYFFSYFIIDIICLSILSTILNNSKNLYSIVYLIKIISHLKFTKAIEHEYLFDYKYTDIYNTIILFIKIMLLIHFFSCLWYYISFKILNSIYSYYSWLLINDLIDESNCFKYLVSLYFLLNFSSITNLDIKQNKQIIIFSIFLYIILIFILSYLLIIFYHKRDWSKSVLWINKYLKTRKLNTNTRKHIMSHFEKLYKKQENSISESSILNNLNFDLREHVYMELYLPIINKMIFFKNSFSSDFIFQLFKIMKEKHFSRDEILNETDSNNKNLYFLISGKIQYFHHINKPLFFIEKDNTIGLHQFFSNLHTNWGFKCLQNSNILIINQKEFIDLLKLFPKDYETYCKIRDSIDLYRSPEFLFSKCEYCYNFNHIYTECPCSKYSPSSSKIIGRYIFEDLQWKKNYTRQRKIKRLNSLKISGLVCAKILQFRYNNSTGLIDYSHQNYSNPKTDFLMKKSLSSKTIIQNNKHNNDDPKETIFINKDDDSDIYENEENGTSSSYTLPSLMKKRHSTLNANSNINSMTSKISTDLIGKKIIKNLNENRILNNFFYNTEKSISSDFLYEKKLFSQKNVDSDKFLDRLSAEYEQNTFYEMKFEDVRNFRDYFVHNNINSLIYKNININDVVSLKKICNKKSSPKNLKDNKNPNNKKNKFNELEKSVKDYIKSKSQK